MEKWGKRRGKFRAILEGDTCFLPASVHDPISARIAHNLGFEAGMLGGSIASHCILGAPDLILLTLSEFCEQAKRISRASELPLMVDADHGYGNALNVMRTIEELEIAGVSGIVIEDTKLPIEFANHSSPHMIDLEEGVGKMSAALKARSDPKLSIIGRTSAVKLNGVEDAIKRAMAYEATGVDAMFFVGVSSKEELAEISSAIEIPIILDGVGANLDDRELMAKNGVKMWLRGHQPFSASLLAVYETLSQLRAGKPVNQLPNLASKELVAKIIGDETYQLRIKKYLQNE